MERRVNPTDRRARALYLTGPGEALLWKARAAVRANEAEFCEGLDPATREQLIALLAALAARHGGPVGVHPGLTDLTRHDT